MPTQPATSRKTSVMGPSRSDSPEDNFFNDMSQQLRCDDDAEAQSQDTGAGSNTGTQGEATAKVKRIACVLCRKRKLRCDGTRPACGTCKRLGHDCAYDEVRRKSGPKRGYVKALEARLHQVETLLKSQNSADQPINSTSSSSGSFAPNSVPGRGGDSATLGPEVHHVFRPGSVSPGGPSGMMPNNGNKDGPMEEEYPWEMIGLGLDEPLPLPEVINELHQIYFEKVHPSIPIIHRPRYLAAMNLAPHLRPPVCLRYIIWALAAIVTEKYDALHEHFYYRARKYAQLDEMRGHGESTITLGHCQAWALLATYEFKLMYFPRAWLSSGRATRLAQMMQLHRLDGVGLDVKQSLPPPKDWVEREERRRTFWITFCVDRYASIGTGWPMTLDEKDIITNLPSTEDAFEKSKPHTGPTLQEVMTSAGVGRLTPFAGVVVLAALLGRNLLHLHRPTANDCEDDLNGEFWKRHRTLDSILLSTALGLPDHLRLPAGISNANVVYLNMNLHTSVICLHQAAIYKAEKYRLPISVANESKVRCITAAVEVSNIMRMISHMDLAAMNPFISFCVYVAARVFIQYLRTRPKDQPMISSLRFLLQAMQALKRGNPLTGSFLVQLDLDLESAGIQGLDLPKEPIYVTRIGEIPVNTDAVRCSPLFEIRETQIPSFNVRPVPLGPEGNVMGPKFNIPHNMDFTARSDSTPYNVGTVVDGGIKPTGPVLPQFATDLNSVRAMYESVTVVDSEMDLSPGASGSNGTINSNTNSNSISSNGPSPSMGHSFPSHILPSHPDGANRLPATSNTSLGPMTSTSTSSPSKTGPVNYFPSPSMNDFTMATEFYPDPMQAGVSQNYSLQGEWDLGAEAAAGERGGVISGSGGTGSGNGGDGLGTGLNDDESWNQMLEGMGMGWEGLGPSHNSGTIGR